MRVKTIRTLSVAKFGGSLLSEDGQNIPTILKCVTDLKNQSDLGPIVVFSAPNGFTDKLIQLGESCTRSEALPICDIFNVYEKLKRVATPDEYYNDLIRDRMGKLADRSVPAVEAKPEVKQ